MNYNQSIEIEKQFNLSASEAACFNLAISDIRNGKIRGFSTEVEALQKTAMKYAVKSNIDLTNLGDMKLCRKICLKFLPAITEEDLYGEGSPL